MCSLPYYVVQDEQKKSQLSLKLVLFLAMQLYYVMKPTGVYFV